MPSQHVNSKVGLRFADQSLLDFALSLQNCAWIVLFRVCISWLVQGRDGILITVREDVQ